MEGDVAGDRGHRGDWTAGDTPKQRITKGQSWFWTAVVAVAAGVCSFYLDVYGGIPDWASTATIATPIALAIGEVERRRKAGERYSLLSMLWIVLQVAIVTAVAVGLALGFLATEEGFLRVLLGMSTVMLVAVGIGNLLHWFPSH